MDQTITLKQAADRSDHAFIWRARFRDGTVIHEQPGLSSDALPRDDVIGIDYVPRTPGFPVLRCDVDLATGERFVRYWSTVWRAKTRETQRLYVLGVERAGRHALAAFYPKYGKTILAATRPFQPPWTPDPFACLPSGVVIRGGAGTDIIGWTHQGFGGELRIDAGQLVFRAIY